MDTKSWNIPFFFFFFFILKSYYEKYLLDVMQQNPVMLTK